MPAGSDDDASVRGAALVRDVVDRAGGVAAVRRKVQVSRSALYAWQQPSGFPVRRRTEELHGLEQWAVQTWPDTYDPGFLTRLRTEPETAVGSTQTNPPTGVEVTHSHPSRPADRRTRGWWIGLAAGVLVLGIVLLVRATSNEFQVSGTVSCPDGLPVVGVWVWSDAGGSGWASRAQLESASRVAFQRDMPAAGRWTVNVGCGGNRDKWQWVVLGAATVTKPHEDWVCTPGPERTWRGCNPGV